MNIRHKTTLYFIARICTFLKKKKKDHDKSRKSKFFILIYQGK